MSKIDIGDLVEYEGYPNNWTGPWKIHAMYRHTCSLRDPKNPSTTLNAFVFSLRKIKMLITEHYEPIYPFLEEAAREKDPDKVFLHLKLAVDYIKDNHSVFPEDTVDLVEYSLLWLIKHKRFVAIYSIPYTPKKKKKVTERFDSTETERQFYAELAANPRAVSRRNVERELAARIRAAREQINPRKKPVTKHKEVYTLYIGHPQYTCDDCGIHHIHCPIISISSNIHYPKYYYFEDFGKFLNSITNLLEPFHKNFQINNW